MEERFLYSDVWPLLARKDQEIIDDCFRQEIEKSDQLAIAVGFFSYNSLRELDRLITQKDIKNVCLILGMYCNNGFPKTLFQLALSINEKWQKKGIGEIRITHSFKYHGKLYCFLKNDQIFSAIIGSPNLSFLKAKQDQLFNQYEIAIFTDNTDTLQKSLNHIKSLKSSDVSDNISAFEKYKSLSKTKSPLTDAEKTFKIKSSKKY